jgi:hypothetical protein
MRLLPIKGFVARSFIAAWMRPGEAAAAALRTSIDKVRACTRPSAPAVAARAERRELADGVARRGPPWCLVVLKGGRCCAASHRAPVSQGGAGTAAADAAEH